MIWRRAALLLIVLLQGCSFLSDTESEPEAIVESTEDYPGNDRMPFTLTVTQEINDGKELHILGKVAAKTAWNPDYVVVRLTSLKDGIQVGVVHQSLRRLITAKVGESNEEPDVINGDEEVSFSLSVPSADISDYQLVLLWGEEAEPYLDKRLPRANGDQQAATPQSEHLGLKLRVHSIEIETLKGQCPYPPCDVRFRLKAMLQNEGKAVIQSAKLGVGFVPSEIAAPNTLPEDEESVDVPNLNLAPGQSRPFRILLNQEMSEEVADTVRPVLRILSFE